MYNIFKLHKTSRLIYTISINNLDLLSRQWYNGDEAVKWARAFVSSFPRSTLDIEFKPVPDCSEFWND